MKYETPPQEATVVCEGDATEWSVGITRTTIERILKSGRNHPMEMIGLWMFYAYTAKWQETNQPRATVSFVMKATGWGRDKIRDLRNSLKELGLIEDVQGRGEDGVLRERYVRVKFLTKGTVLLETSSTDTVPLISRATAEPCYGKHGGKMLKDSKKKCFNNSKRNSQGLSAVADIDSSIEDIVKSMSL